MQLSKYYVKTQSFGFNFVFTKFLLCDWFFLSPKISTKGLLFSGAPSFATALLRTHLCATLTQSDDAILTYLSKPCQQQFKKNLTNFALFLNFFTIFANTRGGVGVFIDFFTHFITLATLYF